MPVESKPAYSPNLRLNPSAVFAPALRCYVPFVEGYGVPKDFAQLNVPHYHDGPAGLNSGRPGRWIADQFADGPVFRCGIGSRQWAYRGQGLQNAFTARGKTFFGIFRYNRPPAVVGGNPTGNLVSIPLCGVGLDTFFTVAVIDGKSGSLGRSQLASSFYASGAVGTALGAMQVPPNRFCAFAIGLDDIASPRTRRFFLGDYSIDWKHPLNGQGGTVETATAGYSETTSAAHFVINGGTTAAGSQFFGDWACAGFAETMWTATEFDDFYDNPWGALQEVLTPSAATLNWPTQQVTLTTTGTPNTGSTIWRFYLVDGTHSDVTIPYNSNVANTLSLLEAVYGTGKVWVTGLGNLNSQPHTITYPGGMPPPQLQSSTLNNGGVVTATSVQVLPRVFANSHDAVRLTCPPLVGTGSGGTGAPTYQWHRSIFPNFTPSVDTAIPGETDPQEYADTTAEVGVPYAYVCVGTDGATTKTSDTIIGMRSPYDAAIVVGIGSSILNSAPHGQLVKMMTNETTEAAFLNLGVGASGYGNRWSPSIAYPGASAQFDIGTTNGTVTGGTFTLSGMIGGTLANGYTDGTAFGPTSGIDPLGANPHTAIASAVQTAAESALPGTTVSGAVQASRLGRITFGGAAANKHIMMWADDSALTGTGATSGNLSRPIVQVAVQTLGEPSGTAGNAFNSALTIALAGEANILSVEAMVNDGGFTLEGFQATQQAVVAAATGVGLKVVFHQGTNYWAWPSTLSVRNALEVQRQVRAWMETDLHDGVSVFVGPPGPALHMAINPQFTGTSSGTPSEALNSAIYQTQLVHPVVGVDYPPIFDGWSKGILSAVGVPLPGSSSGGGGGGFAASSMTALGIGIGVGF